MSTFIGDPEYTQLVEKFLDEDLAPADMDRLSELLQRSPEALRHFLETVDISEDLKSYYAYQSEASSGMLNRNRERILMHKSQVSRRLRRQEGRSRRTGAWGILAGIAALLLVLVGVQAFSMFVSRHDDAGAVSVSGHADQRALPGSASRQRVAPPATRSVIATVLSPKDGLSIRVRGAWQPFPDTERLHAGDEIRVQSDEVTIQYLRDQTRLKVYKNSLVRFEASENGQRVHLLQGALSSEIAKQSAGRDMTFVTAHLSAKIVGTKIRLANDRSRSTLDVLEGQVNVTEANSSREAVLGELESISAGAGANFEKRSLLSEMQSRMKRMGGLALWLDGDDLSSMELHNGRLTKWLDKSGNNRHAVQTDPARMPLLVDAVVREKSAVRFTALNRETLGIGDINDNEKASWTHFIVLKPIQIYNDSKILGGHYGFQIGIQRQNYLHTEYSMVRKSGEVRSGEVEQLTFLLDQTRNLAIFFKNGELISQNDFAGERWVGARLSGDEENRNHYYDGDIAEVITFSRALSAEEQEHIEGYLKWKWNLVH